MKKLPPFLLGIALLFWGWQTGISVVILAFPMAILFEGSRWINWRWEVSKEMFQRLAKITSLIILALYLLCFLKSITFIDILIKVLPILLFPLLIIQTYSNNKSIDISSLFLFIKPRKPAQSSFLINLELPYLLIVLVAASVGNQQFFWFYGGIFLIFSAFFWKIRSNRFSPFLWLILLLIAGSIGLISSWQVYQVKTHLEQSVVQFLGQFFESDNPFQSNTKIGDIGTLKQSNKILFRLKMEPKKPVPSKIRKAGYNLYKSSMWIANKSQFLPVINKNNETKWLLSPSQDNSLEMKIYDYLGKKQKILNLPQGVSQISQLPIDIMEKNQYGTIRVAGKPKLLNYHVLFNPNFDLEDTPNPTDLQVPESEIAAIQKVIQKLNIEQGTELEKLKKISAFFANNFSYSLKFENEQGESKSLADFLLTNPSGHCEYFATATTLLLRSVGIPARYVTGYAIHEFSPLERLYIIRSRHAHAWTLAYINGAWQEVDTTPSNWINLEVNELPKASFLSNVVDYIWFKTIQVWQWTINQVFVRYVILIFVVFLILRQQKLWTKISKLNLKLIKNKTQKLDSNYSDISNFYLIEKTLNQQGLWRYPSETLRQWLLRLEQENHNSIQFQELFSIIDLYYQDRFDPQGIDYSQKEQLLSLIQSWLQRYNREIQPNRQ
ncbi:MAG TPA: transglutaminase [Cyanothece sp. UBA12306]|nr:transglutaminase [Cyanothece sp. UBA12306]